MKFCSFLLGMLVISNTAYAQTTNREKKEIEGTQPVVAKIFTCEQGGFAFEYPNEWVQDGEMVEIKGLNGLTTSVIVNFIANETDERLTLEYFLPPNGLDLYKYSLSQFNSSNKSNKKKLTQTIVAGHSAITSNMVLTEDGKGHQLKQLLRKVVVEILDDKETGEIKMQFLFRNNDPNAVENMNSVLSTFRFITISK